MCTGLPDSDLSVLCKDICIYHLFFSLKDIMNSEKSYDSLPNFTAADCKYCSEPGNG